ncbi:MAG: hypothetical protein QNJ23_01740 [Woeseiaceae bacterium]|nr:hypothetical protein [Woeseiaceae bacterium]
MSTDGKKKPQEDVVIPMPDIYAEEFAVDESFIEENELEPVTADTKSGFNPYDTARLYIKK